MSIGKGLRWSIILLLWLVMAVFWWPLKTETVEAGETGHFCWVESQRNVLFYGSLSLNGQPVATGVEVGAFGPDGVCIGGYTVGTVGSYGLMKVAGYDGWVCYDNGLENGEVITFLIYANGTWYRAPKTALWNEATQLNSCNLEVSNENILGSPPPVILLLNPTVGSMTFANTSISLRCQDDEGIDPGSLNLWVNCDLVIQNGQIVAGVLVKAGSARDVSLTYSPSEPFSCGGIVEVLAEAKDQRSNFVTSKYYTFQIGDSEPPVVSSRYPADGAVDIGLDSSVVIKIQDDCLGIDAADIQLWVNEIEVTDHIIVQGSPLGRQVTYKPVGSFGYHEEVTVLVVAEDAGGKRVEDRFKFTTIGLSITRNGQAVGDTVSVNEEETLSLQVTGTDQDNPANNLVLSTVGTLPTGADFDPDTGLFTWTPAQGASAASPYTVQFKVQETDGVPAKDYTRSLTIEVIYPSLVIEDFEYTTDPNKPESHGWFRFQGQGQMKVLAETLTGGGINHYMNTVTSYTDPTNASATEQVKYVASKFLVDPPITGVLPQLEFTIADHNLYYFDAYIHAVDNNGQGKNYFIRYIPQNPPATTDGKAYEVVGIYVKYYIGQMYINPAGVKIIQNMENDLHDALAESVGIEMHYDYLMGILLRGDIQRIDDIKLAVGTRDYTAPKPVDTFNVVEKDKAVILSWTNPSDQADDVLGYRIEWDTNSSTEVLAPSLSCTIDNLVNNTAYTFSIKVFDDAKVRNISTARTVSATPVDTTPPDMSACGLTATSLNKAVKLEWDAPDVDDLMGFDIFNGAVPIITLDKDKTTFTVANLENDTTYTLGVRALDDIGNRSEIVFVQGTPKAQLYMVFEDFNFTGDQTPGDLGFHRLQGSGNMNRVDETDNSYMCLVTDSNNKLNYVVTKFSSTTDYNNEELNLEVKGTDFRIDVYVQAINGSKYFLSYRPDNNATEDYTPASPLSGLYIIHYLGWKDYKAGTTWKHIVRNLSRDIQVALGNDVVFEYCLGFVLRGELCIDNIVFKKAVAEVLDLIARPGDEEVELSWTCSDPNNLDDFLLKVDNGGYNGYIQVIKPTLIPGTDAEYKYLVTGLTNGIEYTFKVFQKINNLESNGVSVSAIPLDLVDDDKAPDITCPSPIWVGQEGPSGTTARHLDIVIFLAGATVYDEVDGNLSGAVTHDAPLTTFPPGQTTITFTAKDKAGNSSTCTSTITIRDTTSPSITPPPDLILPCDSGTCRASITAAVLGQPTVTDICDPNPTISHDASAILGPGQHIITWTARDQGGNMAKATQKVTVIDNQKPVFISCPGPVSASCDPGKDTASGLSLGQPEIFDNCDPNPSLTNNAPAVFPRGETYVIWKATDLSGQTATCDQKVTVVCNQDDSLEISHQSGQGMENDIYSQATLITPNQSVACSLRGEYQNLKALDDDWYRLKLPEKAGLQVTISFVNAKGDLDLMLFAAGDVPSKQNYLAVSNRMSKDEESISCPGKDCSCPAGDCSDFPTGEYLIRVYGYGSELNDPKRGGNTNDCYQLKVVITPDWQIIRPRYIHHPLGLRISRPKPLTSGGWWQSMMLE